MVENIASRDDRVTVTLYSDHNTYQKIFKVPAGDLIKINVRDLQQNGVPDDNGNLLLGQSGVLSLVGSHNTRSELVYDKLIHSANQSDYVGFTANPCDFVTGIGLFVDTSSGSQPFPVDVLP